MLLAEWLPNALLIGVALICAAHFREARQEAVACALLVGVDWLEYVLSWSPWSIYQACKHLGLPLGHADIWMLTDAMIAAIVVSIGLARPWAGALWFLLSVQVVAHGIYLYGGWQFDPYSRFLDWTFWAQILCFVVVGGPNVVDRVYRAAGRLWNGFNSPAPARRSSARR